VGKRVVDDHRLNVPFCDADQAEVALEEFNVPKTAAALVFQHLELLSLHLHTHVADLVHIKAAMLGLYLIALQFWSPPALQGLQGVMQLVADVIFYNASCKRVKLSRLTMPCACGIECSGGGR
jgi:hypothetical protein